MKRAWSAKAVLGLAIAALGLIGLLSAQALAAKKPVPLTIVVFTPPSLGAFLPAVIEKEKFDRAHGLAITFVRRTPDAYAAEFNSGEFKIGGSASLLSIGNAALRGVKVSYLLNLFDFWGAVVTRDPAIKTVRDLHGKELAAAKGTTNFRMFAWLAGRQGLDVSSVRVLNTAPPGLVGYALANRADAVELWEPAYSLLLAKAPDMRTLDLDIRGQWRKFAGSAHIPYLGVAAHESWIRSHPGLIKPLLETYEEAAKWVQAHPAQAAVLVAPKADATGHKAIAKLIRNNRRLGLDVQPAAKMKAEIEAVYRTGMATNYLKATPPASTIYSGK